MMARKRMAVRHARGKGRQRDNRLMILAAVVITAAAILYLTAGKQADSGKVPYPGLDKSSEIILKTLVAPQQGSPGRMAVVIGDQVDSSKLQQLASTPYDELKSEIGVKSDFAIYFINGNDTIVQIGSKPCIGSPRAEVDGKRCG